MSWLGTSEELLMPVKSLISPLILFGCSLTSISYHTFSMEVEGEIDIIFSSTMALAAILSSNGEDKELITLAC
jgi:hypothetical protein